MFSSTREAKEFAISQIVEQAAREGTPLDEVERKMLYFTETDWTLPDMDEVSDAFDAGYDSDEYENKIADLITNYLKWTKQHDTAARDKWKAAIKALRQEDHYLLVFVDMAAGSLSKPSSPTPPMTIFKLLLGGVMILVLLFYALYLKETR